jgi:ATP-dependent protease HslVU (ClpYQ) peptidase subunit
MTCIVGLVHKNGVTLAADSIATGGTLTEENRTPKLALLETTQVCDNHTLTPINIGIGYTSSYRMGDLLKYNFNPPKIEKDQDANEYLVKSFVPELIECFDKHHFTKTHSGVKEGGEFLVAIKKRLFIVQGDFSILEPSSGFSSVGSGSYVALGALYSAKKNKVAADLAVVQAVEAASAYTTSVGGKITTLAVQ